jgi:hypothetical protein
MVRKGNSPMPISCKIKKARLCTKKDTLQRLEADLHAKQAHKYTPYFHICSTFFLKNLQRTQAKAEIADEINPLKNAKLGTFLDVSSFETPFSYCGRISPSKIQSPAFNAINKRNNVSTII